MVLKSQYLYLHIHPLSTTQFTPFIQFFQKNRKHTITQVPKGITKFTNMQVLFDYFDQFQKLSEADKRAIGKTLSIKKVNKYEFIEEIGSTSRKIYFLKSGIIRTNYFKDDIDDTVFKN